MRKYITYFKYVFKHKWYVMLSCFKEGLIWQGIMHDMSKFRPSEFIPYANYFYGKPNIRKNGYYKATNSGDIRFDIAWLKHIHRNKHHWQYWLLQEDDGDLFCLPMPYKYIWEMVCDWKGAGRALGSEISVKKWYEMHKHKMHFSCGSREQLESILDNVPYR